MFDLGWFELAVVGGVLLVVVGPKDLPKVLRTVGIYTGKARKMAREFQKALDDYAKDAELDGVKKAIETPGKVKKSVASALDPTGTIKKQLTETNEAVRDNLKEAGDTVKEASSTASDKGADAAGAADPTTPEKPEVTAKPAGAETPADNKVSAGNAS
ncbi:MAG: twin-arginine translocase subunit TatB [Rhodospirillaceae bacterium]|nr:twin-arginine translocase subunit TatB [Rhodospirillaceae bacterium]